MLWLGEGDLPAGVRVQQVLAGLVGEGGLPSWVAAATFSRQASVAVAGGGDEGAAGGMQAVWEDSEDSHHDGGQNQLP